MLRSLWGENYEMQKTEAQVDKWMALYEPRYRALCKQANALDDLMCDRAVIPPDILKAAVEELADLKSTWEGIVGPVDPPYEMLIAEMLLADIQEEFKVRAGI